MTDSMVSSLHRNPIVYSLQRCLSNLLIDDCSTILKTYLDTLADTAHTILPFGDCGQACLIDR